MSDDMDLRARVASLEAAVIKLGKVATAQQRAIELLNSKLEQAREGLELQGELLIRLAGYRPRADVTTN